MRCVALITLCLLAVGQLSAQVAFGHPDLATERVDLDRLRDLVLGRRNTWSDGSPVILVLVRDDDDPVVEELTGMSLPRLLRGWKRLVFAGSGAMPLVVDSAQAGLELTARRRGALLLLPAGSSANGLALLHQPPAPAPLPE
jgi:hypothetical protein